MALFKKKNTSNETNTNDNTTPANPPEQATPNTVQAQKTVRVRRQYVAVRETTEQVQVQVKQGDETITKIVTRTKRETIRYTEDVFVQQTVQIANPIVATPTPTPEISNQPETTAPTVAEKKSKLIPKIIPKAFQKNTTPNTTPNPPEPETADQKSLKKLIGVMMIETIDVFSDELLNIIQKNGISKSDSWAEKTKHSGSRIQSELATRFAKRQIMQQAKQYKAEDGIKELANAMPNIVMKILLKMPTFIFAVVKEASLSMGKCVQVLRSDDENKFDTIVNILSESTAKVITLYVQTVVSTAIAGIPLVGRFSDEIAGVLVHMLKTMIPLLAVYAFEQGKNSLVAKVPLLNKAKK